MEATDRWRRAIAAWSTLLVLANGLACAKPPPPPALPDATQKYELGPGDVVEVQVYGQQELQRKIQIPEDERIFFPLVGELDVSGMSPQDLRRALAASLDQYVVDPQVSVELSGAPRREVFVLGEVRQGGGFDVTHAGTPMEAITRAGGFTIDAKQTDVILIRGRGEETAIARLNLKAYMAGEAADQNPKLEPGDIVFVRPSVIADLARWGYRVRLLLSAVIGMEESILLGYQLENVISNSTDTNDTVFVPTPIVTPAP